MAKGKYQEWLEPDGLLLLEGWARDGLTDEQIATVKIGVTERTFTDWKSRFSSISSALKKGRAPRDYEVENALLKRAIGFEYTETIKDLIQMPDGTQKQHVREIKRYMPPDPAAIIFYLKNRMRGKWKDKPEQATGSDRVNEILQSIYDMQREGSGDA